MAQPRRSFTTAVNEKSHRLQAERIMLAHVLRTSYSVYEYCTLCVQSSLEASRNGVASDACLYAAHLAYCLAAATTRSLWMIVWTHSSIPTITWSENFQRSDLQSSNLSTIRNCSKCRAPAYQVRHTDPDLPIRIQQPVTPHNELSLHILKVRQDLRRPYAVCLYSMIIDAVLPQAAGISSGTSSPHFARG